jgi:hypothetical protein
MRRGKDVHSTAKLAAVRRRLRSGLLTAGNLADLINSTMQRSILIPTRLSQALLGLGKFRA